MPVFGGTEAIPATMPFAPIPRSTLRYNELAGKDEPLTVGVTEPGDWKRLAALTWRKTEPRRTKAYDVTVL